MAVLEKQGKTIYFLTDFRAFILFFATDTELNL